MDAPEFDIADRKPIWDFMQKFWMDTDPEILLPRVAEVCAKSKYSIDDLEAIFWNEVRPAVSLTYGCFRLRNGRAWNQLAHGPRAPETSIWKVHSYQIDADTGAI